MRIVVDFPRMFARIFAEGRTMTGKIRLLSSLALFAIVTAATASAAEPRREEKPPYLVVDGKVDDATFLGWRAYHSACHACHGVDATGTEVAPSLVERVKAMSASDFSIKVLTSYRIVVPQSEAFADSSSAVRESFLEEVLRRERGELVMPAWESNTSIHPHVLDLYAYLRARADGALGPGKPQKMNE